MGDNRIARRDFMKRTAAVAVGASVAGAVLSGSASAEPLPRLPIGVVMGMLPEKMSDKEKFELAKRCGIDGIEGYPIDDLDAAKKQADTAREAGIVIHSIMFGGWGEPFSDPDEAKVNVGLKKFENCLRCANAMGIDNILLVPAIVNADVRYADAYDRSQNNIRKVLPLAEELKIVIAVENVWNDFLLSPMEFARYVDEFESEYLKAYFDTGNIVKYGWPQDWIRTLGKRINRVHLKDYTRQKNGQWKPLREGDVNWPEVRKALAEVGYNNFCTAEVSGGDETYMKELAKTMELCVTGQ